MANDYRLLQEYESLSRHPAFLDLQAHFDAKLKAVKNPSEPLEAFGDAKEKRGIFLVFHHVQEQLKEKTRAENRVQEE